MPSDAIRVDGRLWHWGFGVRVGGRLLSGVSVGGSSCWGYFPGGFTCHPGTDVRHRALAR